jgi:hypothetical protein
MEESFDINGMTFEELKDLVARLKARGRQPFFHYTTNAGTILKGPLIDEIIGGLYATFDKTLHVGFIVPRRYQKRVDHEINGYGD